MAARRTRKQPSVAASPLVRTPKRVEVSAAGLLADLRAAYAPVGAHQRMPDDLRDALRWAGHHHGELAGRAGREAAFDAALLRTRGWQYLRQQASAEFDHGQLGAVDDALAAGAVWAQLVEPLAVSGPSGAHQRVTRMRGTGLTDAAGRPVRRTPEAIRAELDRREAERAADLRRQAGEDRRHHLIARAADQLLAHREALTPDPDGDSDFWLDQAQAVLDYGCACAASAAAVHTCPLTPLARANLALYLTRAVGHLRGAGQPDEMPEPARTAWTTACAVADDPPESDAKPA